MALPLAPLALSATGQVVGGVTTALLVNAIFEDDSIVDALSKIQQTLILIDQAIVAGFAGRDIQLTRLDAALATANGRLDATQEQIERIEPFKDTQQREGAGLRVRWRELAEEEARLLDQVSALHQARMGRLDELNGAEQGDQPLSGTNCCCPHEQVMDAVNKAMPMVPRLGLSSGSDPKLAGLEDSVNKGKVAIDGLISPEAKANLNEFSAKFTGIFEQASRDGKITAGEIGNSFKQMAAAMWNLISPFGRGMGLLKKPPNNNCANQEC